jgi:hypothetical protein
MSTGVGCWARRADDRRYKFSGARTFPRATLVDDGSLHEATAAYSVWMTSRSLYRHQAEAVAKEAAIVAPMVSGQFLALRHALAIGVVTLGSVAALYLGGRAAADEPLPLVRTLLWHERAARRLEDGARRLRDRSSPSLSSRPALPASAGNADGYP